jgi:energy-coupling factor transport system permease protein
VIGGLPTVPQASILVRLDFRTKLVWVVSITIIAFLWDSPIANLALVTCLLGLCALARVRAGYLWLIAKIMAPFYVLVLVTHGFWNVDLVKDLSGHATLTPLFTLPRGLWIIGGASASVEGVLYGISVIAKTLALILVVPLAIFTTEVDRMIVGMVRARIPYKVTFIFSSTLRFFPVLFQEIQTIIEAQRLRGLALETLGPIRRVRIYARIAVPLILGALVRAQQLEVVLQSKAFSGSHDRTYLHDASLGRIDWALIALGVAVLPVVLVLYFGYGLGRFSWLSS